MSPRPKDALVSSRAIAEVLPRDGRITQYLLAVNFFMYLATVYFDQQNFRESRIFEPNNITLFLFGGKDSQYIFAGQWWRLITAGFLHGSLMHIAFNSWGLYQLGAEVDDALDTGRYICVYIFSTITGFLASSIFSPGIPSVGASAGIFGLLGALIGYATVQGGWRGRYMRSAYMLSAIFALLLTAFTEHTDHWAHLGGVAGGFLFVFVIGKLNLIRPSLNRAWSIAGLLVVVLVLGCFVLQLLTALRMMQN